MPASTPIQFLRGTAVNVAAHPLPDGMPAWTTDTHQLFIGQGGTNYPVLGNAITALTGDVAATGPGSAAATIQPHAVTYAKMQVESAHTLLGNPTAGGVSPSEITLGTGLAFSGTTLVCTISGGSGTVTSVDGSGGTTGLTVSGGPITASGTLTIGGVLIVTNGGTGLTSGTDGGILGFTSSNTLASSVAMTLHALMVGGGPGATPTPLASLGTTTTVLHGDDAGDPSFGSVVEDDQELSDVTTWNVSITAHGYVPKAPNDRGQYLCGDGTWRTPPNGGIFFFLAKGGIIIHGTSGTPYAGETSFTGSGGITITE